MKKEQNNQQSQDPAQFIGVSDNGNPGVFETFNHGSNPCIPANFDNIEYFDDF